jgi:hypothetical protein
MLSDTASPVAVGDIYCVTAHPYIRWTVVAVRPPTPAEGEVVLRSTADPAVQRTISRTVLGNPLRFMRVTAD